MQCNKSSGADLSSWQNVYIQLKQVHSGVIHLGLPVNRQQFTFLRMESFADCNKLPSMFHSSVQDI